MKFNRADYRFLSDEEFTKLNGAVESKNATEQAQLRQLNEERQMVEQTRVAQQFVASANMTRARLEERSTSDVEQLREHIKAAGNSILAGLDLFLYNRADYRNRLNARIEQRAQTNKNAGIKRARINYIETAALAGKDALKRYVDADEQLRALLTTADAPGAANTIQTTVAQSIVFRAENIGNVLPLLNTVNIPSGNYDIPYYNKYAQGGYVTETGTVPDFNTELTDATDGIKKVSFVPKDFVFGLEQSFRSLKKLSPEILDQIFEFLAMALTTGMEYQAVSGPGTGQTDSGMLTVATSITAGADVFEKFINARSSVAGNNVRNIVAFANAKAIGEFVKLKVTNEAYRDMIVVNADGLSIANTQLIEVPESIIPVTAGTPDTTQVVLGDPMHYVVVNSGTLQEYEQVRPEELQKFTAFHMLRDGGAIYGDSFAKFTINLP